ncbi:hypothetical protein BB170200_00471 [Mycobacterium marinum]|nr:hypothetical protein BB170200_00471 [Mycobacterium marinum]
MVAPVAVAKPLRAFGGFYSMALDTFVAMVHPPFAWREYIAQAWFVARVSLLPTLMLTIPYTVLLTFIENILLTEIGAADFSGTGAALGSVRQIGPIVMMVIGGTVAIVGFLTVTTGALVAVQGYSDFSELGVEALTGFASAFFNVRLIAPATTAIALSATIGAGATAQLGAMRINDEIDALEVMGIRTIAFLAASRVVAGLLVVIPLYCVGVLASFWAARFGTTVLYSQVSTVRRPVSMTTTSGRS